MEQNSSTEDHGNEGNGEQRNELVMRVDPDERFH